jgi:hypothetical protein
MSSEEIKIAIQSVETDELLLRFEGNTLTSEARLVYIEELKNRGVKVVGLEIDENATKEAQRSDQAANVAFKRGAKRLRPYPRRTI